MATHDGCSAAAYPFARLVDADALLLASGAAVIGIDEGQFFPDICGCAEAWAARGCHVIVAALDATFLRTPFPGIIGLIPLAEGVTKLTAVCAGCGADAAFTRRTAARAAGDAPAGGEAAHSAVLLGGAESYAALCRGCYAAAAARDVAAAAASAPHANALPQTPPAVASPQRNSAAAAAAATAAKKRPLALGGAALALAPLTAGVSRLELASSPMAAEAAAGRALLRRMR